MLSLLRYVVWGIARLFLGARYRRRVHGAEVLNEVRGPVLILPNHPAYVDPLLVYLTVWPKLKPRPMVYMEGFQNPIFRFIMKLLNAIEVPDLEKASTQARDLAERAVAEVIAGLKRGENYTLWPTGHTQRDGVERLGGARATAEVLRAVPEAQVLLVRTRGLWGSSLSWARTNTQPDLLKRFLAGLGWIFANLLFFMPRRKVDITLRAVDRSEMPEPRREVLNRWLEQWYNEGGPEEPTYVPYHFLFGPRTYEFPPRAAAEEIDLDKVKPETKEEVAHLLAEQIGRPLSEEEQRPETMLDQLGLDSIDRMEITLQVERRFGVSGGESPASLAGLWALAQGLATRQPPKPAPPAWFRPLSDEGPLTLKGDTIPAAFVERALANRKDVVLADDLSGALTFEKVLVGALTMARRFAKLPGDNVGLLLPASVGCDVALMGLHLAGKLPVVLNWTTGPGNLGHAARIMKLQHIVTSKAFIDRTGIEVPGTEYLFLEQVRQGIGKLELLRTLLKVRYLPGRVRRHVPKCSPDQPAVVLFTSGSEKAPKAVLLTHDNILSDQRFGVPVMQMTRKDVLIGFLPAFHSFGMTVTALIPLLSGLRVVHHPDPTDAASLARKIAGYKVTLLIGTPTFVKYILDHAKPEELTSLRLIVVGAEKCPPFLFDRCAEMAPGAKVVEGYGITECAPVVAVNPPDAPRPGSIGKALPGLEVRVVDLETEETLPAGQMGMLWVSGPTVFPGYIAYEGESPFVQRDGKRWYVTGDLAEIDADGYIWFKGRLKRFLKAGGEMISLPALEGPFARLYPPTQEGPRVAVEGVERDHGRRIVLFTTESISLRDANALLVEEGFHGVMRLDEVRKVDQVPVLGTGKTDYKVLRARIESEAAAAQH